MCDSRLRSARRAPACGLVGRGQGFGVRHALRTLGECCGCGSRVPMTYARVLGTLGALAGGWGEKRRRVPCGSGRPCRVRGRTGGTCRSDQPPKRAECRRGRSVSRWSPCRTRPQGLSSTKRTGPALVTGCLAMAFPTIMERARIASCHDRGVSPYRLPPVIGWAPTAFCRRSQLSDLVRRTVRRSQSSDLVRRTVAGVSRVRGLGVAMTPRRPRGRSPTSGPRRLGGRRWRRRWRCAARASSPSRPPA